ncbi:MAG TPA: bifunctional hydroxymethylpyrimidine kinase/phosphomethylpyrimidine kinase [Candidimonas sp.]|nr:bifunctional hydroxymethylpyrimidine kinase/phosphomethylpyrimidine kinase [Candidimonas sp.]
MIINAVQASTPPLVLIFGPFDPSGSSSLPADAVTCATLGCHALSTLTAILVQDTASTEDVQPVAPELIDDQARCLLEDMAVQAIKVGPLYTTESVSVLAQIAADYTHVPLVLHLGPLPDESLNTDIDTEDLLSALFELLLPQTDIVVASHNLLEQWHSQGAFASSSAGTPAQALLHYGAKWVLTSGAPLRPGHGSHLLQGQENQTASWTWQAPPVGLSDADGPLACAITAQLARGQGVQEAVESALLRLDALGTHSFQPGMGHRLINRSTP